MGSKNKYYNSPFLEQREVQCWDVARYLPYDVGVAFAYIWRAGLKTYEGMTASQSAVRDCKKAVDHLNDHIEHRLKCNSEIAPVIMSMLLLDGNASDIDAKRYSILETLACGAVCAAVDEIKVFAKSFR